MYALELLKVELKVVVSHCGVLGSKPRSSPQVTSTLTGSHSGTMNKMGGKG